MALDYEPTEGRLEQWQRSPFYHVLETGETLLRLPIHAGSVQSFRLPSDLLGSGATEYRACITRFGPDGVIGGLDCVYLPSSSSAPRHKTTRPRQLVIRNRVARRPICYQCCRAGHIGGLRCGAVASNPAAATR